MFLGHITVWFDWFAWPGFVSEFCFSSYVVSSWLYRMRRIPLGVFMLFNADMFPPLFTTCKIEHYVTSLCRGIGFLVFVRPTALILVICTCDYDIDCDS